MTKKQQEAKKLAIKKYAWNLLKFTAPMLALFFLQLSNGVDVKIASGVAILAFYGAIADGLKKLY